MKILSVSSGFFMKAEAVTLHILLLCFLAQGCAHREFRHARAPSAYKRMQGYIQNIEAQRDAEFQQGVSCQPSDEALISKSRQEYERRGFDAKTADQNARADFIEANGRFPVLPNQASQ